jgi:hypothetical protein
MARQVVSRKKKEGPAFGTYAGGTQASGAAAGAAQAPVDSYTDRLLKYIPVEIVAAFLALDNLIRSASELPGYVHWLVFAVLVLATPLYLAKVEKVTSKKQLGISTVAFVVWVVALPGPFGGIVTPVLAAILLILYTLFIPIVEA